ncbi:TPA: hypothetical protein HA246_03160 [Candidatus Woesearchaeota archaeon]|nr:hypothetical protein [Candidatus Woesearchaeota archaeon]
MAQKEVVTTEVDELIKLVQTRKEISIADAAKALSTSEAAVEQFADLLQEEGILELKYKFTTPYLSYKSGERAEHLMAEQKKAESFYVETPKESDEESTGSEAENDEDLPESLRKKGFGKATLDEKSATQTKTTTIEIPEPAAIVSEDDKQKLLDAATELARQKPISEKVADFNSVILQVYEDMKNGNFDTAKELYNLITHYYEALPEKYTNEKDKIVDQLVGLSKKLAVNIDMFNENEFNDKVKKITELGRGCYNLIDKKNFNDASQKFTELKELYSQLPNGFLEKKSELHDKLVKLHEALVTNRAKVYSADLSRKSAIIAKHLDNGWNALEKEDVDTAVKIYQEIRKVQKALPSGFMQKKIQVGEKITEFYEELASMRAEISTEEFRHKQSQLRTLLEKVKQYADTASTGTKLNISSADKTGTKISSTSVLENAENINSNISTAVELFRQAKQVFASLPKGFLEEKSAIETEMFKLDKQLLQSRLSLSMAELKDKKTKILSLITLAEKYIAKDEPDLAATIYDEILNIYNTLPTGYLEEKTKLKTKMLDVYKRSVLRADSMYLKNVDAKVQEHYSQLLQLIINAHKHVEAKDFKALTTDYEYIKKVYEELPVGFIKNKLKIVDEISKVGIELELLGKTEELKNTYLDDYKKAEQLLTEVYRLYDYLQQNSPEDRNLLDYVKDASAPYTIKLLEKGSRKIKNATHEIASHAKSASEKKKSLEEQRKASNIEIEQQELKKNARLAIAEKEKKQFTEELLEQRETAMLEELEVEKERDTLVSERNKIWQSKDELQAVMKLNEEVLREREQLKNIQEKQLLKKAKEEFIKKQIDELKKDQKKKQEKLRQEGEQKKKELEELEQLKLQEQEKINLINELERVRTTEKKTLDVQKKEHLKIIKEREQIKKQVAALKKKSSKTNLKKIQLLNTNDNKLRKKLSEMLRSRESGISGVFIPKEKRLLDRKVLEQAEPVELGEKESGGESGTAVYQTQGYQSYSNLPHTEIDEEILKLEREMQDENTKTLGLEQEQMKFDAQLELMTPEQPVLPVERYKIETENEMQEVNKNRIESIKTEKQQKVQEKIADKEQKEELKSSKKEQKSGQKAQKQEKAQPMTWIEKKQIEIQRKLDVLNQGMLSEPKKGKSA